MQKIRQLQFKINKYFLFLNLQKYVLFTISRIEFCMILPLPVIIIVNYDYMLVLLYPK